MTIKGVLSDMDGVIYRGRQIIPGAQEFVKQMKERGIPFLFLTNNSEKSALDLQRKLEQLGITGIEEDNFITAAMATASFLKDQKPGATIYAIGGAGLMNELYRAGFSISETDPDYVVVGKTSNFSYDMIRKAVRFVNNGAKLIGTNPDIVDPVEDGFEPACGALLAPIEVATGKKAFYIGKPNALMMTIAKNTLGTRAEETLMIGDRMDTDIIGGLEAGMKTALVMSGVSDKDTLAHFPYRPNYVVENIGHIDLDALGKAKEE